MSIFQTLHKKAMSTISYLFQNDAELRLNSEQWCTSWWHQFKVLLLRGLRERRYDAFNRLRIFQVISVAILGGLLWWNTPTSHIEDRVRILIFKLIMLL